jgi:hypothetical protein
MSKQVGCLIWTEDDVLGAMEDNEIELTEDNIERAVSAVENANMGYAIQIVNEEIDEVVSSEFN